MNVARRLAPGIPAVERSFPAEAREVRAQLLAVRASLAAHGIAESDRHVVELVLAEAMNNVVEHAYRGRTGGAMRLSLRFGRGALRATLIDRGVPFVTGSPPLPPHRAASARPALPCPASHRPAPLGSTPPCPTPPCSSHEVPEGGFGWQIIRMLCRNIACRRERDTNILALSIPLA